MEERARDWQGLARRLGDPEVWDHVRSKGYAVSTAAREGGAVKDWWAVPIAGV